MSQAADKENRIMNRLKGKRLANDLNAGGSSSDLMKFMVTKFAIVPPGPASSGEGRCLNPLWVCSNREGDEPELPVPPTLSFSSFSQIGAESSVVDHRVIKEKIKTVLMDLTFREQRVLVQFWAPITVGNRRELTTSDQPFGLGLIDEGLYMYRMHSLRYKYVVDGENKEKDLGPPGRVFQKKLPEWTPDVRQYSSKECPQRDHAILCGIQGSLALPVFEPSSQLCVGVLEILTSSEYTDYAYEVQEVCRALKDVNLKSPQMFDQPSSHICDEWRQQTLDEILKALEVVCETHKLPLAQTWVLSRFCSVVPYGDSLTKSCSSFDVSCRGQVCMSTTGVPFYLLDVCMWHFRKACTEHHLQKGHGVVGMALSFYSSWFCRDVTQLSETNYPLVHFARMSGLTSCFAICLPRAQEGDDVYIVEFFLPPSITDNRAQDNLFESLLVTMKQHIQSFKDASGMELRDILSTDVMDVSLNEKVDSIQISHTTASPTMPKALPTGGNIVLLDSSDPQSTMEVDSTSNEWDLISAEPNDSAITYLEKKSDSAIPHPGKKSDTLTIFSERQSRKRRKTEELISLEAIQRHFGMTIEDAAKSLGVSRTTLKRICRQHNISRWPSRKRYKDNGSPLKLKPTNESIQGTDGVFIPTLPSSSPLSGTVDLTLASSLICPSSLSESVDFCPLPASLIECNELNSKLAFLHTEASLRAVVSVPDALVSAEPELSLRERQTESTVNSKKLRNVTVSAAGAPIPDTGWTDFQCSDLSPKQAVAKGTVTMPPVTAMQRLRTVTMKATYRDDTIKFQFSLSSGIAELEEQVARRLQLNVGSFSLKYLDEDNDWILITCDTDLCWSLDNLRSLDSSTTIKVLVESITN